MVEVIGLIGIGSLVILGIIAIGVVGAVLIGAGWGGYERAKARGYNRWLGAVDGIMTWITIIAAVGFGVYILLS